MDLRPLSPRYVENDHGTYLQVLEAAIDEHENTVHNIALAGAYGVGKSSILSELARRRKRRVINVSLLTLGAGPRIPSTGDDVNPAASTTSNRIQKEIVKQLLYKQSPRKTTLSRFRRIDRPHWFHEIFLASVAGLLALVLLSTSGVLEHPGKWLGLSMPATTESLRYASSLVLGFAIAGIVTLLLRAILRGRFAVAKLAAGPAAIELSPRSTSYFDEYLDEIVYFFEINPAKDIVIIEDLDRFNDPYIYESLRSLNQILNESQQLGDRNIRFIYAVRDSIFENLGRAGAEHDYDDTRAELGRANRTKFFELIIPVVPFVTHINAREVMHHVLEERGHEVRRDLIDIASRHLPDMRTIINVVNEYEVFRRRLLDVKAPVPGLDAEKLFAMVLFKNTQAADFEGIRRNVSSLDRLFETWRALVRYNIDLSRAEIERLNDRAARSAAAEEQAAAVGQRLRDALLAVTGLPGTNFTGKDVFDSSGQVADVELDKADFWQAVHAGKKDLSLRVRDSYGRVVQSALSPAVIEGLTGLLLDNITLVDKSNAADRDTLKRIEKNLEFLERRHTWQELLRHGDLLLRAEGVPAESFRELAKRILPSDLVFELVSNGFITSYFALHVSVFYGKLLPLDAMTYIMRNVDGGKADLDFPLSATDVDAIIADQGSSVLLNPSMRNVSILDRLLDTDATSAEFVIGLALENQDGTELINRYFERGQHKPELVAVLAPNWNEIFSYLVQSAHISLEERWEMISIAIEKRDDVERAYEYGYGIGEFLEQNAPMIRALSESSTPDGAEAAVSFVVSAGAVLPDASRLSPAVRSALGSTRNYTLSAANIEAISGTDSLALDSLKNKALGVYNYVLSKPSEYFAAIDDVGDGQVTATSSANLGAILTEIAHWPATAVEIFIKRSDDGCMVRVLTGVPPNSWRALVEHRRVPASFDNVIAYIRMIGGVDESLASLISSLDGFDGADAATDDDVTTVAIALVNASLSVLNVESRIRLTLSLETGVLPTASIQPQAGPLIGELIRVGLIADDEDAFSPLLMVDWPTQEHAATMSTNFPRFAGPATLKAEFVTPLLESKIISADLQVKVINSMQSWGVLPRTAYEAAADCARRGRVSVDQNDILTFLKAGVARGVILNLLAEAADRVDIGGLRYILRTMGGNYALVADPSRQRPKLPDSNALRAVLGRLDAAGIVSGVTVEKDGSLRVNLHHR